MTLEIREESFDRLEDYARVPIAFEVGRVLDPADMVERRLVTPYVKDYDAIEGNHPSSWPERFDLTNWGLLAAWRDDRRVGGAVMAHKTEDLDMLEGARDLAVLWDLRVSPDARRRGVGSALFAAAVRWAKARGCRRIKVETQDINVAACRFYERQGCLLGAVNPRAYSGLGGEIQLLWYRDLDQDPGPRGSTAAPRGRTRRHA